MIQQNCSVDLRHNRLINLNFWIFIIISRLVSMETHNRIDNNNKNVLLTSLWLFNKSNKAEFIILIMSLKSNGLIRIQRLEKLSEPDSR